MAKSQETYSKKEKTKKRLQKRKEKEQLREEKKQTGNSSTSFEDMLAYVDEDGNLTTTPPDPTRKRKAIKAEDIAVSVPKLEEMEEDPSIPRTGTVTFFNHEKGFGFIEDAVTKERVFVHINDLSEPISENEKVSFTAVNSPRGKQAENVKKI